MTWNMVAEYGPENVAYIRTRLNVDKALVIMICWVVGEYRNMMFLDRLST